MMHVTLAGAVRQVCYLKLGAQKAAVRRGLFQNLEKRRKLTNRREGAKRQFTAKARRALREGGDV
jgi:hypothetical protein